jgi:dTDP-4-dehydrorhamnose 3,5-epimerase
MAVATVTSRLLDVHLDPRGSVRESYRASWNAAIPPIVQIVHSESRPGVMRAMHAHALQFDIWHFTNGPAYVQLYNPRTDHFEDGWYSTDQTLVIPPGIAHGFYAPYGCTLIYGLTREYDGTDEYEFNATDPEYIGHNRWPVLNPTTALIRSERDLKAPSFAAWRKRWLS